MCIRDSYHAAEFLQHTAVRAGGVLEPVVDLRADVIDIAGIRKPCGYIGIQRIDVYKRQV